MHPDVLAAMHEQLDRVAYAHTSFFTTQVAEELADDLVAHAPKGIGRIFFVSGGSEAIEAALKLARMCYRSRNFVGLLSSLQAQYPGIELQIMDAGTADLQARLLDGALEAAIYCWPDRIDDRLHSLPLFRERFFIVSSRRHRLAANNAVRVSDLNGERDLNRINCVCLPRRGELGLRIRRLLALRRSLGRQKKRPWARQHRRKTRQRPLTGMAGLSKRGRG